MRLMFAALGAAVAFAAAAAGGYVQAQNAGLDRLRLETLQQQNMQAQEQAGVLRRSQADLTQLRSDQVQAETAQNLRDTQPVIPSISPPGRIQADDSALTRLQDRELAASNARLRAITPASQ